MRLYIRRFLGVDVSGYTMERTLELFQEAQLARELEVGVAAEAIARVFAKR